MDTACGEGVLLGGESPGSWFCGLFPGYSYPGVVSTTAMVPDGVVVSVVEVVLRVSEIATEIFGRAIGSVAGLGRSVRPQYGLRCLG